MPPKTSKKIKELQGELKLHDSQLTRAVDYARKHPKESKAKVAKAFGVNPTTVRRWKRGISLDIPLVWKAGRLCSLFSRGHATPQGWYTGTPHSLRLIRRIDSKKKKRPGKHSNFLLLVKRKR